MPIMSSGAASPIARESPRIVPVAMPGTAEGSVCRQVVCHTRRAQRQEPSRISRGTARTASRVVMMMTGRISSDSATAPLMTRPR